MQSFVIDPLLPVKRKPFLELFRYSLKMLKNSFLHATCRVLYVAYSTTLHCVTCLQRKELIAINKLLIILKNQVTIEQDIMIYLIVSLPLFN